MPTVALIGPDGAGKTTIAHELQRKLRVPSTYLYMGVNFDSSNRVLPTTRLIRWARRKSGQPVRTAASRPPARQPDAKRGLAPLKAARSAVRLLNRIGEETYREILVRKYRRAGHVVIFDRHFFADYYGTDVTGAGSRRWSDRLHGLFLNFIYPKPDLIVYLDAPVEVLFARKREGTLESLTEQKRNYERLESVAPRFVRINADRPLDSVVCEIAEVIENAAGQKSDVNA